MTTRRFVWLFGELPGTAQRLAWGARPVPMLIRTHIERVTVPVSLYDQDADWCDPAGIARPR